MNSKIKAIAFDLDDTLIDTSGLLVPQASKKSCKEMLAHGLQCDLESCLSDRARMAPTHSHKEIFKIIANTYSPKEFSEEKRQTIAQVGIEHFYNPEIPTQIPLMNGASEVLQELSSRYALYVVTSGSPETQKKKLWATGAQNAFKRHYFVDGFKGEIKQKAFEDILHREKIQPHELLSIGNRLSQEIRQAKKIGAMTCYFEYGEHVGEPRLSPHDHPDYTIHTFSEFIPTCKL